MADPPNLPAPLSASPIDMSEKTLDGRRSPLGRLKTSIEAGKKASKRCNIFYFDVDCTLPFSLPSILSKSHKNCWLRHLFLVGILLITKLPGLFSWSYGWVF